MNGQNRSTAFMVAFGFVCLFALFLPTLSTRASRIADASGDDVISFDSTPSLGTSGSIEGVTHVIEIVEGEPRPVTPSNLRLRYAGGLQFKPRLITICVGDRVEFKNNWKAKVNVFSYSQALKFDVGRFKPGESRTVGPFPKEGLVRLYDEIHSHMKGFINVVDCSPKGREQSIKDGQKEMRASLEKAGEDVGEDNRTEDSSNKTGTSPDKINASVHQANGLLVSTFDTTYGQVRVNLPGDMRAGDTISGTVIAEPKGRTNEERSQNLQELRGYVIEIRGEEQGKSESTNTPGKPPPTFTPSQPPWQTIIILSPEQLTDDRAQKEHTWFVIPDGNSYTGAFKIPWASLGPSPRGRPPALRVQLKDKQAPRPSIQPPPKGPLPAEHVIASTTVPYDSPSVTIRPEDNPVPKQNAIAPTVETHVTTTLEDYQLPKIGQQGRPIRIVGPFDGDFSNTGLIWTPAQNRQQSADTPEYLKFRVLAESPRSCVLQSVGSCPCYGSGELKLTERNIETKGEFRNFGVQLSAPKTILQNGETVVVTIRILGLMGIRFEVPLRLVKSGSVSMQGGDEQTVSIKPDEVQSDGTYTTTRTITGQQTGAFSVTATIISKERIQVTPSGPAGGQVIGFFKASAEDTCVDGDFLRDYKSAELRERTRVEQIIELFEGKNPSIKFVNREEKQVTWNPCVAPNVIKKVIRNYYVNDDGSKSYNSDAPSESSQIWMENHSPEPGTRTGREVYWICAKP